MLDGLGKQGLCSSTWDTALGAKCSCKLIISKDIGPQSYNCNVLDSSSNLNMLRSILLLSIPKRDQSTGDCHLDFGLVKQIKVGKTSQANPNC